MVSRTPPKPTPPDRSRLHHAVYVRRRLLISVLLGAALFILLPDGWRLSTRLLASWDLTALIYIVFAFRMMHGSTVETCRTRAALYLIAENSHRLAATSGHSRRSTHAVIAI